ncbi:hypothetical protein BGI41_03615 [Methanobrevibacter sp. 87.7]|uniref:DUF2149 domain-containing protein n=1 Tax=Methanobrevibacter sp. 87.7 TaxID=387957 RepID=UPI000B5076A4|nr:DUF2149 domain-containing protein [Methanobrevibacter sp. 87.7]OWT33199.1 hypothetical protein BGI41_03615 [Methanobrevibacter sp. 87.7]
MLRKKRRLSRDDGDPMSGLSNLSDVMLVLALGFLIFAIMALQTNPNLINHNQMQSQSQSQSQTTEQISSSQAFNNSSTSGASDQNGYSEVGKVYKDPETGKLVMVSSS